MEAQIDGPTVERLRHADGAYDIGNDRESRRVTMLDTPLARLYARRAIAPKEYGGLERYRLHWHHAGLEASLSSVDPNRIYAADPGSFSGMAKSEKQAFHRHEWREAREHIGHRSGIVVDNVVCCEWSLEIAGHALGWGNKVQARAAATEILRDAGYRLAKWWGDR